MTAAAKKTEPSPPAPVVHLQKGRYGHTPPPFWLEPPNGRERPVICCNCGRYCELTQHSIHFDGTVAPAFTHWCGWRAELHLVGYHAGEFSAE